jgi:ribosomal protein L39E
MLKEHKKLIIKIKLSKHRKSNNILCEWCIILSKFNTIIQNLICYFTLFTERYILVTHIAYKIVYN